MVKNVEGIVLTPSLVSGKGELIVQVANFSKRDVNLRPRTRIGTIAAGTEVQTKFRVEETPEKLKLSCNRPDMSRMNPLLPSLKDSPDNKQQR